MNGLKIIVFIVLGSIVASSSFADIYEWTDENGVRHYSNYAPAAKSKVLMKTKEEPYDEAADRARMAAERQELLELARLELAEREAELELREDEAERKLAEADRMAQEALREADDYDEEDITNSRIIYRGGGYWFPDYRYGYSNYPIHHRRYYRKKHLRSSHYRFSRPGAHQLKRHVKPHFRANRYVYDHQYRNKTHYRHNGSKAKFKPKSRAATKYSGNRIGSASAGLNRRGNLSWKSSGFGRRY